MKKIRTGLALLIVLGFISTLVGGVGYVYGNPDEVRVDFTGATDADNYIDSKTNLVVSGGQVMLEEGVVCESGGAPQTTDWGEGLYGCTGSDERCYNGSCITCEGWSNGGYCWYEGTSGESATTICASHGGVYNGTCNWNGGCEVCQHWHSTATCTQSSTIGPVYWPQYGDFCYSHAAGSDDCNSGWGGWYRQAACNW